MVRKIYSYSPICPEVSLNELEDALSGELAIYWQDELLPYKLKRQSRIYFEEAKEQGYLLIKRGRPTGWGWWAWCKYAGRPYVKIELGPKYAEIHFDLIDSCKRMTKRGLEDFWNWLQSKRRAEELHFKRGGGAFGDNARITVRGVANEEAQQIAERLLSIPIEAIEIEGSWGGLEVG